MSATFTLPFMGKSKGRTGRPKNPDKEKEVALNADIPDWIKKMVTQAAHREGRQLKKEVARRLLIAYGYPPEAEGPDDKPPKK